MVQPTNHGKPIRKVISDIICINTHLYEFWSQSGWPPESSRELLNKSRLDWQVSLSHCLLSWVNKPTKLNRDGRLILAWANLGSLIEGTMKTFLCVFHHDYVQSPFIGRKNKAHEPDVLTLDILRTYFLKHVWVPRQIHKWNAWIELVRDNRNAIHAYHNRDIGTFKTFFKCVRMYREFLLDVEGQFPYPDEYAYPYEIEEMRLYGREDVRSFFKTDG